MQCTTLHCQNILPSSFCRACKLWLTLANNTNVVTGNPKYNKYHISDFSERGGGSSSVDGSPASAVAIVVRVVSPLSGTGWCVRCEREWGSVCMCGQSVRLHAQLSQITAIVQLCHSIRQLQLSEYTCRWENQIIWPEHVIPRYARWRCTHFRTETPPADLFTSPAASAFKKDGVRRARRSYIFVHFVYGVHDNYTH